VAEAAFVEGFDGGADRSDELGDLRRGRRGIGLAPLAEGNARRVGPDFGAGFGGIMSLDRAEQVGAGERLETRKRRGARGGVAARQRQKPHRSLVVEVSRAKLAAGGGREPGLDEILPAPPLADLDGLGGGGFGRSRNLRCGDSKGRIGAKDFFGHGAWGGYRSESTGLERETVFGVGHGGACGREERLASWPDVECLAVQFPLLP